MEVCLVYITAPDSDEATRIGRDLVEAGLAACANVHAPITSIFKWEGEVQQEQEVALIVKTRMDLVEVLTERVSSLHSYETPCVVALPIAGGHTPFLEWITQETKA